LHRGSSELVTPNCRFRPTTPPSDSPRRNRHLRFASSSFSLLPLVHLTRERARVLDTTTPVPLPCTPAASPACLGHFARHCSLRAARLRPGLAPAALARVLHAIALSGPLASSISVPQPHAATPVLLCSRAATPRASLQCRLACVPLTHLNPPCAPTPRAHACHCFLGPPVPLPPISVPALLCRARVRPAFQRLGPLVSAPSAPIRRRVHARAVPAQRPRSRVHTSTPPEPPLRRLVPARLHTCSRARACPCRALTLSACTARARAPHVPAQLHVRRQHHA
jgi:hypothetical protein